MAQFDALCQSNRRQPRRQCLPDTIRALSWNSIKRCRGAPRRRHDCNCGLCRYVVDVILQSIQEPRLEVGVETANSLSRNTLTALVETLACRDYTRSRPIVEMLD